MAIPLAGAIAAPAVAATDSSGWRWTSQAVAPGVSVRTGIFSGASVPSWTVTIDAPTTSDLTGQPAVAELGTEKWAQDTASGLIAAGFPARRDRIDWPGFSDTPRGLEGVRVRSGSYATQADAQSAVTRLRAAGFPTTTAEWTGYDADQAADAEQVHVVVIDPRAFHGQIEATHDGAVAQRETTSAVASKLGAVLAVNGGFFVTADADGYQGVPAGLAAYDGKVESLSSGDRAALVLGPSGARIENRASTVTVKIGRDAHQVEGVNRKPGIVRDCGRPDGQPTTAPRQDFTCTSADELVAFTAEFGTDLPVGPGTQVTVGHTGRVIASGARGGRVPAGGMVIQGIGGSADWLAEHAKVGAYLAVDGLNVGAEVSIVSAAPILLRAGRTAIDAAHEGVLDPKDLSFNYAWAEQRQPRTMAGIDAQGRLLLATVDGRQPGVSEGFTLMEEAQFMRSLGAVDAMNLDGGGSTAMVLNGGLVNRPSDATGERADGDVIVLREKH